MANYCDNSIHFRGPKKEITKLWESLSDCYLNDKPYVTDILVAHGYSERQAYSMADRRDYVKDIDIEVRKLGDKLWHFNVYTDSAWSPNMEPWFTLLKEKYGDKIELLYMSEECGFEIYVTNDKRHEVWTARYVLDYSINGDSGIEYFDNIEALVAYVNWAFNAHVTSDDSLATIESEIILSTDTSEDADCFCNIHRFEIDNAA